MTKQELFERLRTILQDTFDVPSEKIHLEARLYEDLDVDSIDAVDMIVQLRPLLGKRLQPDAFKSVRTLHDVVETVYGLLNDPTT
ncbi:acyl carrier protein [Rhodoferax sp.]|uniref:acyl carrier protein n=1 Tax=Rhodoferax sp. TaxID=50421 RepID=UPI002ACD5CA1|nr:acyl carrier protein [Rhodoferax sp.]MDZ7918791.1 acyl carrier protein [Rhodoferax sp.]